MLHSCVNGMLAGHQSAPGRCANWSDVIAVQQQARVCQSIDIWRWDLSRSVKSDVVPSLFDGFN